MTVSIQQKERLRRTPMYRKIADSLGQQIISGQLQPGDALASEAQLQEIFSVSRVTVRKAIKQLIEDGHVRSIQGSGNYVCDHRIDYNIYHLSGFGDKLGAETKYHSRVINFELTTPTPALAQSLQINEEESVYFVKRVRFIDSNPVLLEETWMPVSLFPDITLQVMQNSKYNYIEKQKGLRIDYSEQEIIPVMPSEEAVQWLHLDPEVPIIKKITRSFLDDGTPFELSYNFIKSSDYKFTFIARRHGAGSTLQPIRQPSN